MTLQRVGMQIDWMYCDGCIHNYQFFTLQEEACLQQLSFTAVSCVCFYCSLSTLAHCVLFCTIIYYYR